LRISNTYFHTELQSKIGGTDIFSNDIIRSNWNYQFTKEWSLRFITQYDETVAGPASRLTDDENLNFDLLLRYVINPWSAFFIGYNSNQSNFDIVEMEGERELVVANDLRVDGDQIFMKSPTFPALGQHIGLIRSAICLVRFQSPSLPNFPLKGIIVLGISLD